MSNKQGDKNTNKTNDNKNELIKKPDASSLNPELLNNAEGRRELALASWEIGIRHILERIENGEAKSSDLANLVRLIGLAQIKISEDRFNAGPAHGALNAVLANLPTFDSDDEYSHYSTDNQENSEGRDLTGNVSEPFHYRARSQKP